MRNFKVLSTRLGQKWSAGDTVAEAELPPQDVERLIEVGAIEEIVYNERPVEVEAPAPEPTGDTAPVDKPAKAK